MVDSLSLLLKSEGHEVVGVLKGQDAMLLLEQLHPFDLLVADLRMAPVDGVQLIKRARAVRPSVPVIVVSAYLDQKMIKTVTSLGAVTYVKKPFEIDDILTAVNNALKSVKPKE